MALAAAPEISGFRALSPLGYGPTSTIYSAQADGLGRWVALTVYSSSLPNERAQRRFARAFEVARRLGSHPNVVTMLESGLTGDCQPYVATEIYERGTLQSRIDGRFRMPVDEVLHMGVQLAGALETAHRAEVVHGGIHPARVLLSNDGDPALADLGLVPMVDRGGLAALVSPMSFHAPPEVLEALPVTPATDVFALASTLWAALAGRAPYQRGDDDTTAVLLVRILHEDVPPLDRIDAPKQLEEILRGALRSEPGHRPERMLAFARQLQNCQKDLGLQVSNPTVLDVASSIRLAGSPSPPMGTPPVVEPAPPSATPQRVFVPAPEDIPAAAPPLPGAEADATVVPRRPDAPAAPPAPSVHVPAPAPAPLAPAAPPAAEAPAPPGLVHSYDPVPLSSAAPAPFPSPPAPPASPATGLGNGNGHGNSNGNGHAFVPGVAHADNGYGGNGHSHDPAPPAAPESAWGPVSGPASASTIEPGTAATAAAPMAPLGTALAVQAPARPAPPPPSTVSWQELAPPEKAVSSPFAGVQSLGGREDESGAGPDRLDAARPGPARAAGAAKAAPPSQPLGASRALPVIVLVALVVVLGAGLAWAVTTHDPAERDRASAVDGATIDEEGIEGEPGFQGDDGADELEVDHVDVTAVENPTGVQLDWDGGTEGNQVVLVLSETEGPRLLQAETGTALLVPGNSLAAQSGYCFAVATTPEPNPPAADVASGLPEEALSPASCIRGASPTTVRRG